MLLISGFHFEMRTVFFLAVMKILTSRTNRDHLYTAVIAKFGARALFYRTAYDPASGLRHLQGCYLDRDEIHSRMRVLARGSSPAV